MLEEREKLYIELIKHSYSLKEVCEKANIMVSNGNYETLKKVITNNNIDISHFKRQNGCFVKRELNELLKENVVISSYKLKKKILKNGLKEYKCEKCGRTEWEGESIPLELHHINGNKTDNRIENLMILCPNCHALTNNYCGKNQKTFKEKKPIIKRNILTKEDILKYLENKKTINYICNDIKKRRRFVISRMKKYGINKNLFPKEEKSSLSEDEFNKMVELMREHKSFTKVGKILGVSDKCISKRFKKMGFPSKIKELLKVIL